MYKICSIVTKKIYGKKNKILLDCENYEITSTNAMNIRYRNYRQKYITKEDDIPTIWVLIGENKSNDINYLQVGQSKNLTCMLSNDIGPDVSAILSEVGSKLYGSKYEKLTDLYTKLIFFEINLNDYDLADIGFNMPIPQNMELKKAYLTIKASYIEGKIAAEKCCSANEIGDGIWNAAPTGIDGYFYSFFKSKM